MGMIGYSTPADMILDLSGMPLTVLMVLFFAERLPMSETAVATAVGCERKSSRRWLGVLAGKNLVFRIRRYGGWDLTRPAIQLKMQFMIGETGTGNNDPSLGNNDPSLGNNDPSLGNSYPSLGNNYPSQPPYYIDLDRSIDREGVDSCLPGNALSLSFLKKLGITGDLQSMAWANVEETLAAWWACQWGNDPPALLAKHLLDRRPIDETYSSLASWRMSASPYDVEELLDLLNYVQTSNGRSWRPDNSEYPPGMNLIMFNAAVKIYTKLGGLPLG